MGPKKKVLHTQYAPNNATANTQDDKKHLGKSPALFFFLTSAEEKEPETKHLVHAWQDFQIRFSLTV
jgi:hypothetical protein